MKLKISGKSSISEILKNSISQSLFISDASSESPSITSFKALVRLFLLLINQKLRFWFVYQSSLRTSTVSLHTFNANKTGFNNK